MGRLNCRPFYFGDRQMKINFNQELSQINGQPLLDADTSGEGRDIKQATMKNVVVNALMFPVQEDNGETKLKKYNLANKIYQADDAVEITIDDAVVIKKAVGKGYGPAVVGPIFNLLESVE